MLFFPAGLNPPEDVIGVNTYPVHSSGLPLIYCTWNIFLSFFKKNLFVLAQVKHKPRSSQRVPLGWTICVATSLKLQWLWKFPKLFMAFCSMLYLLWAVCKWKEKVNYGTRAEFYKSADCQSAMLFLVFSAITLYSARRPLMRGQGRARPSSPTKVGSVYQAFHCGCIFTNGNTSDTLLYLISPWWQTVNH